MPIVYKIYTIPLLAAFYLPSIIIGAKIIDKLYRGYDYIKRLSRKVEQTVYIGYAGIAIVIINWLLIYMMSMANHN